MLEIVIPENEYYDESKNEFVYVDSVKLSLEHSLVSISKWESKWCKPFLDGKDKTNEEILDYIKCMIVDDIDESIFDRLTENNLASINAYIESPMTATKFSDNGGKTGGREIITSEIIYYWMVAYNIPFECQHWHLNRLLALVRVCNIKNSPPKKMSKQEVANRNRELNKARRKQLNSSG